MKGSRWLVLAFLFVGQALNYLDRVALSVAVPVIAVEMSLSPSQVGLLLSVFFMGYTPLSFLGGYAADRFGARRVIGASAFSWSAFCALTAAPLGFLPLLGVRLLFGMGEGPFTPSANKVIGRIFTAKEYGGALSLASAGQPIGGLIAAPIVGAITLAFGWRAAFAVIGAIGFLWAIAWLRFSRREPGVADEPTVATVHNTPAPPLRVLVRQLATHPAVLAVTFAYFGFAYILYFFLTWYPSYLVTELHFSLRDMSVANSVPWLMGLLGLIAGGFLSNYLSRWSWGALLGRKAMLVGGLIAAAICVAVAGAVPSAIAAVALMGAAAFFIYLTGVTYFGILQEVVAENQRGSATGFALIGASAAGIVAPALTGGIVEATGQFGSAFAVAGVLALIGAIAVAVFVRTDTASVASMRSMQAAAEGSDFARSPLSKRT